MECCVIGCSGDSGFGIQGFYNFPRDNRRKLEWLNAMGRLEEDINVLSALCSSHFTEECFEFTPQGMLLKMDAKPSVRVIRRERGISDISKKRKHGVIVVSTATVRINNKCKKTQTDNIKQVEKQSHMNIIKEIIKEYNSEFLKKEHLYILESIPEKIKEDLLAIGPNDYNIQIRDAGNDCCNDAYDSDTFDTKDTISQNLDFHNDSYTETQTKSSEAKSRQPKKIDIIRRTLQAAINGKTTEENYLLIQNKKEPKKETLNTSKQNAELKKRRWKSRPTKIAPVSDTMEIQYLTLEQQLQRIKVAMESNDFLKNSHRCYKCGMSFKTEFHYRQHMVRHDKTFGTFECTICSSYYPTKIKLDNHTLSKHRLRFRCKLCNFETPARHFANIHTCGTTESITYPCKFCNKVFSKAKTLYCHKHAAHKSDDYICSICSAKFNNLKGLATHHSICRRQIFECQSCRHKFRDKHELSLHQQVHYLTCRREASTLEPEGGQYQREPLIRCEQCNKNFKTRFTLMQHLKLSSQHIKPEAYKFQCAECSAQYPRRIELIDHLQIHTNEWRYRCSVCDKTFKSGPAFYAHKRYTHSGGKAKVHPCAQCDKRFYSSGKLLVHIRSHTGQKPFVCDICGNGYPSNCSLTQHMKGVHLKIRYVRAKRRKRSNKKKCSTSDSE